MRLEVVIRRGLKPPHQHGPNSSHHNTEEEKVYYDKEDQHIPIDITPRGEPVVQHLGERSATSAGNAWNGRAQLVLTGQAGFGDKVGEAHDDWGYVSWRSRYKGVIR
jgi:hypothetical protein